MEHQHSTAHNNHSTEKYSAEAHSDHGSHASMIGDFKKRFFITLILTVPVMLLSPMIQHWLGVSINFPGEMQLLAVLSTIVFLYGGWPFLHGFVSEIKSRKTGMMTLIAVAISVAYVYSVAVVFGLKGMDFFWELCTLILIMLLGHWIEMKSVMGASRELEMLVKLMPAQAHLIHENHTMDVRTDSLKAADIILIKPGEKVAADGTITDGESYVDESLLTGESVPVKKRKTDKVIAGSVNGNGSLKVEVSHASADSYLSRVVKLVQDAQKSKSKTQLLADKAAKWLTVIALGAGATTFFFWYLSGNELAFAVERMVTVIVICCPHALGLAVPLVVAKSTSLSAKHGLLIKNRTAFENSRKVSTVVFDKTGTLTFGRFRVVRFGSFDNAMEDNDVLQTAYSLEQNSEHPIASGIIEMSKEKKIRPLPFSEFKAITGQGISGMIAGKSVMVSSPSFVKKNYPEKLLKNSQPNETVVYIIVDQQVKGYIALADEIRPESKEAINRLHKAGIKAILLTGDNKMVAETVSKELNMDGFFAEVLPHEKLDKIKELQQQGEFVAMTGDGVNDAPALAQADVGIAVGSGSDIAAETAGIVLVNSNPMDITRLILFGKGTYNKMVQNLIWATGYNVIALPLAAGVLYQSGILLSPAAGAVLMSLSTIVVAFNARLLNLG
jgi:P-type Cu2+ transporter